MKKLVRVLALMFITTALPAAGVNTSAPKFILMNSHHQKRALADYKGKVVFINFWASWCAPCQVELPELNRFAAQYAGKKVRVLAINVDTDRTAAKKLLTRLGGDASSLEILWDTQSNVVSTYNIAAMPSSFILDSRGVIRFIHVGFHPEDPAAWRREIDPLLARP